MWKTKDSNKIVGLQMKVEFGLLKGRRLQTPQEKYQQDQISI